MRKAGVPESVIMAITGHSTRQMFDRYNTIDEEDKKKGLEKMGYFLAGAHQNAHQQAASKSCAAGQGRIF
ncbi:conserved domain protein [delta proteobacterium NaphS2]|nr:conserved domain protein [delta proteobacterium NaphS2]